MNIQKWQKAVIHLEGVADSLSTNEIIKQLQAPTPDNKSNFPPSRDIRYRGTAVFYKEDDRYFMITARHVLHGPEELARRKVLDDIPDWAKKMKFDSEISSEVDRWIFHIIFRVPSLDEYLAKKEPISGMDFLMNLQAGTTDMAPYTYSTPENDLAVISLNHPIYQKFAESILRAGYEPISPDDMLSAFPKVGDDVFSMGYPDSTSVILNRQMSRAEVNWASSGVSQPVASFGKVSMRHQKLPYFWADISIYPGNSGGPLIMGDKLIGIVSRQATVENTRIPFAYIIRAELINDLLKQQRAKDLMLITKS